jgi:serine/threonine protein kinase
MSVPIAPPAPTADKKAKKIIIHEDKIIELFSTELIEYPENIFSIKEIDMKIDHISSNLLKSNIPRFVAIPKTVYVLQPCEAPGEEKSHNLPHYKYSKTKKSGSYGDVQLFPTHKVAVKTYKNLDSDEIGLPTDFLKELGIYKYFSQDAKSHIPHLYDFTTNTNIQIQLELGISLHKKLKNRSLPIDTTVKFMFTLLKSMRNVSSQGIIHCDLKPENCIIVNDTIKIIDWGLAEIDHTLNQKRGKDTHKHTISYASPEILYCQLYGIPRKAYNYKIDIFSLGLMFVSMYTYITLFKEQIVELQLEKIIRTFTDIDNPSKDEVKRLIHHGKSNFETTKKFLMKLTRNSIPMPEDMADTIAHMLEINQEHRWSYDDLILSPMFQHINRVSIPKPRQFYNSMPVIDDIYDVWKPADRKTTLENLKNISFCNELGLAVLCSAIQLLDLYTILNKDLLQYTNVDIACLNIAMKLFSTDKDLSIEQEDVFTIVEAEKSILSTLRGAILIPSLYSYVARHGIPNYEKVFKKYLKRGIYKKPFSDIEISKLI